MLAIDEVLSNLRSELVEAWASAFATIRAFDDFLFEVSAKRVDHFPPGGDVFAVINNVVLDVRDGPDWPIEIFGHACRKFPRNTKLRALAARTGWYEAAPELPALEEVGNDRRAAPVLEAYLSVLSRTAGRADAVGAIKTLHDLTDEMRRMVFLPLRSFGILYAAKLHKTLLGAQKRMRDHLAASGLEAGEFAWIEDDIGFAIAALATAAENSSSAHLDEATEFLRGVVEVEMTGLDNRLVEAARFLDLATLVDRLRDLHDDLAQSGIASARLVPIAGEIEKLAVTERDLSMMIALHHAWQRLDSNLNHLENALAQDESSIRRRWKLLLPSLDAAVPGDRDACIEGLCLSISDFETALQCGDIAGIQQLFFNNLATLVRHKFTSIDKDLRDRCERISGIGASLARIVEAQHAG